MLEVNKKSKTHMNVMEIVTIYAMQLLLTTNLGKYEKYQK